MTIVRILLAALVASGLLLAVRWTMATRRGVATGGGAPPTPLDLLIGFVTNFFDTLGIGSFAPTTAWLKLRRLVPDRFIPVTLNTGHALPSVVQALIFITLVRVDPFLLAACIVSAVCGATLGAPLVLRLPVRVVQGVVGVALLIAATIYALANLGMMPAGGDALALPQNLFIIAVVVHFVLGALMTFGIGMYAPSLMMLSLMGLNPTAAFPIMMGACAFLMPVSGLRFLRSEGIDLRVLLGITLGGIPAVLLAAYIVKSLPLVGLRWGVVVVVLYAAALLLRSALTAPRAELPATDTA